ncbi:hypothetical protein VNI00_009174 [Paramarasmius palmivorus]|uniref:F-box domain-containing protein n=1 Tax=Paramarasmius palmivorus TaxID=297713 RepID=A0AAW0CRQ2_9AGAR
MGKRKPSDTKDSKLGQNELQESGTMVVKKNRKNHRQRKRPLQIYKRVPNEIWLAIFDYVTAQRDLLHFLTVCKRFYALGRPTLYRTIFFTPITFGALRRIQTTLETLPNDSPLLLVAQGMVVGGLAEFMPRRESVNPYACVGPIIAKSFSARMTSLVFVGVTLLSTIHHVLSNLPNLQRLHFYSSYIEAGANTAWLEDRRRRSKKLAILPQLRELRLWRNEWYKTTPQPLTILEQRVPTAPCGYMRTLMSLLHICQKMHTLYIDWNAAVPRILCWIFQNNPVTLRYLCLRMPPTEAQVQNTGFSASLLPTVLSCFPQLEEFRVIGNVHIAGNRTWHGAPPPLRIYTGPHTVISAFEDIPALERVTFTHHPGAILPRVDTLSDVFSRMSSASLQELNVYVHCWDEELIYCIRYCFPQLKVLRLSYADGHVNEDGMAPFAAEHMVCLRNLEIFHLCYLILPPHSSQGVLYHPRGTQGCTLRDFHAYLRGALSCPTLSESPVRWSMSDEETKELLVAWNKYVPHLREVRFTANGIWRRHMQSDGQWGVWKMYDELSVQKDLLVYNDSLEVWKEFESLRQQ